MAGQAEGPDTGRRPATPWWVKAIGIALLVVLVLAAIVFVIGGGRHGPGMHGSGPLAAVPSLNAA